MYLVHQPDTHLVLDVALPPERVVERFRAEASPVRSVQWSPALGRTERFVAELDHPGELRMRVRHGYSNGFTRVLRARVEPTGAGTRLHLTFHSIRWVEWLMRSAWLVLLVPLTRYAAHPDFLLPAAGGAAATIAAMLAVEVLGRALGNRDERTMRMALDTWFSA